MTQKLAILDVDGTLFDGNLGIEYLKTLISEKIFSQDLGKKILSWYEKYKSGEVEINIAIDSIYGIYAIGMTGIETSLANQKATETFRNVKSKIYPFSQKIIQELLNNGFQIILLSGSPIEMVRQIGGFLGLDQTNILGGNLEIVDDKYTGKIFSYPGSASQKVEALNNFIFQNNIDVDFANSVAIGDNERESNIMTLVGNPITFNPSSKLLQIAQEKSWPIATEATILDFIVARDH